MSQGADIFANTVDGIATSHKEESCCKKRECEDGFFHRPSLMPREKGFVNLKRKIFLCSLFSFLIIMSFPLAGVAELADALDSKSGIRKGVWVRAPPPVGFYLDRS